jgi:hypothetical protein
VKEPVLVLCFDPPLGREPTRSRVTNASRQLGATVCDVDGRELALGPGESVEAVFRLGAIAKVGA